MDGQNYKIEKLIREMRKQINEFKIIMPRPKRL